MDYGRERNWYENTIFLDYIKGHLPFCGFLKKKYEKVTTKIEWAGRISGLLAGEDKHPHGLDVNSGTIQQNPQQNHPGKFTRRSRFDFQVKSIK